MSSQCVVVRPGDAVEGRTGVTYASGVSAASAGAQALCLEVATLPPGARARAHLHEHHESAAYVVSGAIDMWFGEQLEQKLTVGAGEFVFIPPGVPHLPMNASASEQAVAVLARSDPNENESTVPLPHLDAAVPS
jgi:uncharacterized RmlC-like cupin family protein